MSTTRAHPTVEASCGTSIRNLADMWLSPPDLLLPSRLFGALAGSEIFGRDVREVVRVRDEALLPAVEPQQAGGALLLHEEGVVDARGRLDQKRTRAERARRERLGGGLGEPSRDVRRLPLRLEHLAERARQRPAAGGLGQRRDLRDGRAAGEDRQQHGPERKNENAGLPDAHRVDDQLLSQSCSSQRTSRSASAVRDAEKGWSSSSAASRTRVPPALRTACASRSCIARSSSGVSLDADTRRRGRPFRGPIREGAR